MLGRVLRGAKRGAGVPPTASARARGLSSAVRQVEILVDGKKLSVPANYTVLQACEEAGVRIPRFCYHDRLSIAGNCRMCLVEVEKSPKPVASCAMPLMPGMKIKTDTPMVHKAREGVMEFLLANHPLDCPICDQGGECDLQDQSLKFGSDRGRMNEIKRTVEDKNIGPFIKTIMTRCIHCTRCVRFSEEIAGVEDLGVTGRGNSMEIGTYVEKPFDSEISGNAIDLCPVGALTAKPYAFVARPWELKHVDSIDCFDAVGANTRLDLRSNDLLRILPRLNEDINEEWLGDKSRFAYDGLRKQRIDFPMIRKNKNSELIAATWPEALDFIVQEMKKHSPSDIRGLVGDFVDAESMIAFKDFLNSLGCDNVESRQDGSDVRADFRSQYTLSSKIVGLEESDAILIFGSNLRMEAPLLNARIRKSVLYNETPVGYIGAEYKPNFELTHLGNSFGTLQTLGAGASGKQAEFWKKFTSAKKPIIIVGQAVLRGKDASNFVYKTLSEVSAKVPALVSESWNGVNVLQLVSARTAALDLGIVPGAHAKSGPGSFYYLLGADEYPDKYIPEDAFVVYQGSHGDKGANRADIVLPGCTFVEKSATYVNTEGRPQQTAKAVTPPADAREDWTIIRALSEVYGKPLPYDTEDEVQQRLREVAPQFASLWEVEPSSLNGVSSQFFVPDATAGSLDASKGLPKALDNFFITDFITRNSKAMARGAAQLPTSKNSYI